MMNAPPQNENIPIFSRTPVHDMEKQSDDTVKLETLPPSFTESV